MGRRKKRNNELEIENRRRTSIMHGDAKRSAVAIFFFALAILFLLGFIGNAGTLGRFLNKIVGILFGWGKWLSPLVLIVGGIILLYRKETKFYVSKLVGLLVAFISILGFFHLYFAREQYIELARQGAGGGYVGYAMAFAVAKLTGVVGGSVILFALFLIGVIVAFNFSLAGFIERMRERKESEEESEATADKLPEEETSSVPETQPGAAEALTGSENIKSIEFVEGPEDSKKHPDQDLEGKGGRRYPLPKRSKQWIFPPLSLLEPSSGQAQGGDVNQNAEIIKKTLGHFGIEVELGDVKTGPTITQYSFRPAVGIKLSKITGLNSNIALALAAPSVRIEAPIPGKSLVGIEVPNKSVAIVKLREFFQSEIFSKRRSNLTLALGKDVSGNYIFADLDKMPHLMVAGATGSGKSVCINSILLSLLYQNSPEDLKLILVDPKRVELSLYDGIPHLKTARVVVENGKVINVLKWAIHEMEGRYQLLQETGSRDIISYNQKAEGGHSRKFVNPETNEEQEEKIEKLPYIVIVIDELADLMVSHGKEVESAIIRIAQMARAVGIHLIVSTQKPIVEVVTSLIKANITTRISFRVAAQIDSRTILDFGGAEKLLGNGDMLYVSPNFPGPKRLQGVFVSESEVKKVVKFIKDQKRDSAGEEDNIEEQISSGQMEVDSYSEATSEDSLYQEIKEFVILTKKASASLLQRHFRIGYPKAARILDMLEEEGVIGPANGSKPREVIVASQEPAYQSPVEDQEKRDKWQM